MCIFAMLLKCSIFIGNHDKNTKERKRGREKEREGERRRERLRGRERDSPYVCCVLLFFLIG